MFIPTEPGDLEVDPDHVAEFPEPNPDKDPLPDKPEGEDGEKPDGEAGQDMGD